MRIILFGMNHELQWKDPTGDLKSLLDQQFKISSIGLVAEEARGLPTTVAQRLACHYDTPWIDIDPSKADLKLDGIYDELQNRRYLPIDPSVGSDRRDEYLPNADGIRETEWVRRILLQRADVVLCLCGFLHVDPFKQKLEEEGCYVECLDVVNTPWFKQNYGTYRIIEENGVRWCEISKRVVRPC
jgi:hypothetical protein